MATVEKLISEFHNLHGDTLREKHKSFQHFLSTLKDNLHNKDIEGKFIAELTPRNELEHLLKIDLLSYLKRNDDLLEILKSGKENHIGRVLKNYQFFAEIIPSIKADVLINELFPQTSYVTKIKIVNRIYKSAKNEQQLDEYFEAIQEKYGLRMAFALLPGCSPELIKLKVEKYEPKLLSKHIIEIYKKDSSFPLFYFNMLKNRNNSNATIGYPSVIKFIARTNIDMFWKLQKEFNFDFKIGKRLTGRIVAQNEEVLKNGEKCLQWFQKKKLYNTISERGRMEDFLLSFYKCTPLAFVESQLGQYSSLNRILRFLSPENRYNLIKKTFDKKYSKDLLSYQMKFTKHFLESIPISVREPIVKKHLEKSDDYTYLLPPTQAISLIKKQLQNCSSSEQRTQKLENLSKTLKLNRKHEVKITEVLKFVFERYRNDTQALKGFVYKFADDEKCLKILNEEQLKLLNQMSLYTITAYSNRYAVENIYVAYLQWLIKNNKSYDQYLMEHLNRISADDMYYVIFEREFEGYRIILDKIIDVLDQFKDNEKAYTKLCNALSNHIFSYNKKHRKNVIPLRRYKHIVEYAFDHDHAYTTRHYLKYLIIECNDQHFHKYFWEHYSITYQSKILNWFFKNDVKQIEENLTLVLSHNTFRVERQLYMAYKTLSTESLRNKITDYIQSQLSFDDSMTASRLIPILSYVDTEAFLRITQTYMPPADGKFEGTPINAVNKKIVHMAVIRSLYNIESDSLLEIVRKVCVADYLKFGLKPLYKIIYNMKEIDVLPLLNELKKSPVSLGKHSLLLSRHLLPTKDTSQFLAKILETERNVSMKNIIFKKSLDVFMDTQSDETWKQLNNYFNIVNCDDTAMHDIMINYIKKIPSIYKVNYIQNTYDVLKNTTSKEQTKKIQRLANEIPRSIFNDLSLTLLEEIITTIIKEMFRHRFYEDCFWNYVFDRNSSRSKQLLSCTIEIMKTVISNINPGYAKLRIPLTYFSTSFCKNLLIERNLEHKELIEMFSLQWSFFPKHCLRNVTLLLNITAAYYESEFDLNKFAFLLNKLLHKFTAEYDTIIISEFSDQLTTLCNLTGITANNLYSLTSFLLQCNDHKYNYILTIYLLPNTFPSEENEYYKWISIIKSIEEYCAKGKDAVTVLFHYDQYLFNHRNEYIWIGNQKFPSVSTTKL